MRLPDDEPLMDALAAEFALFRGPQSEKLRVLFPDFHVLLLGQLPYINLAALPDARPPVAELDPMPLTTPDLKRLP